MDSTQTIMSIANCLEALSKEKRGDKLAETPNGKEERTYNQREAMAATGGTHSAQLNDICKELGIENKRGNKWVITLADVQAIRVYLGHAPFRRNESQEIAIWTTATLKGGAGKTTDTVTLAVGMATEPMTEYRVGFIDLDPQGTGTALIKPNMTVDDFTVGDLMIADFDLDEGETFEQVCRDAFLPTNHPNLRILPAGEDDRAYETVVEARKLMANKEGEEYNAFSDFERIIEAVKDDFDIIFIDTPPQLNAASMSGQYVANGLIVPLRPSENDRDAAYKYMKYLGQVDELLTGLGQRQKEDITILISGVDGRSKQQVKSADEIRESISQWAYDVNFVQSDAVTNCAKHYMTVFDTSPSGFVGKGSKVSLKNAQEAYLPIVNQLETKIRRTWGL